MSFITGNNIIAIYFYFKAPKYIVINLVKFKNLRYLIVILIVESSLLVFYYGFLIPVEVFKISSRLLKSTVLC